MSSKRLRVLLSLGVLLTAGACSDLGIPDGSVKSATSAIRAAGPTPGVVFTSPERASFHHVQAIRVAGTVAPVDSSAPIDALFVQGAPVPVDAGGRFTATVRLEQGLNVLRAEVTDTLGRRGVTEFGVLAGDWAPLTQPIPNAVGVRLNDPALDAVAAILEPIAAAADLSSLTQSPVFDGALLGGTLSARVDLANPKLQLAPPARVYGASDGLHVEIDLQDLCVDVTARGSLFGLAVGPEQALVKADGAAVSATVEIVLDANRQVAVRVVDSSVAFVNFQATATSSTLMNTILPLLRGWIQTRVEGLLANVIADLGTALSAAVQSALAPAPAPEVFGVPFPYTTRGESVTHDSGGVALLLEFDAPPLTISPRAQTAPGSLSTPSVTPPTLSTQRGLLVVVDDDMLNRALFSAWAARSLDVVVGRLVDGLNLGGAALTAGDLARFVPEVLLAVSPSATLSFEIEAGLPPIIEITGAPDLARLSLGEVYLSVFADDGAGRALLAKIALSVRAGVAVSLDVDSLRLSSNSQFPEVSVDVLEEPLFKLDQGQLRTVLGTILPLVIPKLVDLVGRVPIPGVIPPGTFRNLQAYPDSPSGQRLRVEVDMLR